MPCFTAIASGSPAAELLGTRLLKTSNAALRAKLCVSPWDALGMRRWYGLGFDVVDRLNTLLRVWRAGARERLLGISGGSNHPAQGSGGSPSSGPSSAASGV